MGKGNALYRGNHENRFQQITSSKKLTKLSTSSKINMVQFTIRPGHETRDAIVIFKQLQYKYLAKKTICTLYLHISRKIFTEILGIFLGRFKGTRSGGVIGFICAVYWNPQSQVRVNVLTDDSLGGVNCQDSVWNPLMLLIMLKTSKKNEIRMYKRVTSYRLAQTGQLLQGLKWKSGSWKRALTLKGMRVNAKIKIMLSNEISRKASVVGKFSPSNSTLC